MILFTIDADLRRTNLSSFRIKLTGLAEACWVLALHLGLDHRPASAAFTRFNLQQMNQMLLSSAGGDADTKLSDKARDFKQLFESFQKSPSALGMAAPAMFSPASLMSSAPTLGSLLAHQNITDQMRKASVGHRQEPARELCCSSCCKDLQALEERLLKKLDDHQKAQNEKLDKIISLLEICLINKS